jgi:hypothetical protein
MIYAGKKYGPIRLWWAGICNQLFPNGFKWFHTCRYPVSHEPRRDCRRLFWGTVTGNTRARGGKLGFCSKHKPIVKAGWAKYAETKSKNWEAQSRALYATLDYAFCVNTYILATDPRGTLFYIDTKAWPEWASLSEGDKQEPDATGKYMLPVAKERWASLSWQWIEYAPEAEVWKQAAKRHSALLKALEVPDALNRRPN